MAYEIGWITGRHWNERGMVETLSLSDTLVPTVIFELNSVTSFLQTSTAATVPVTVASIIPAGSIVIALTTQGANSATDAVTSSPSGLSFTMRQRSQNSAQATIFTAVVGGSDLAANEVFTYDSTNGSSYPGLTIVVIPAADTSSLGVVATVAAGSTSGNAVAIQPSVTVTKTGAWLLACARNFATWTPTPSGTTTTIYTAATGGGDQDWHFRITSVTTGTGATVIGSTNATNAVWAAAAIEIRPP